MSDHRFPFHCAVSCVLCLLYVLTPQQCAATEYDEAHHADGSLHYKIKLNRDGLRHGKYKMYHPSGKPKRKGKKQEIGTYKRGALHGIRSQIDIQGELVHEDIYMHGTMLYPMSQRLITMHMHRIEQRAKNNVQKLGTLSNPEAPTADVLTAVLTRLNSYRLLCGLESDVGYTDEYIHYAQEGAELCKALGRIAHTPKNPGLPAQAYTDGYQGTSHGNLAQGLNGAAAVDGYMDDSDNSNRDRVGHRRWILWQDLAHIGHGDSGRMSCLYVIGEGKKAPIPVPFTAFPPAGYMPLSMFGTDYAWHISPHKDFYTMSDTAELNIYRINPKTFTKTGAALAIQFRNVERSGFGHAPAIIAQPQALALKKGDSFIIEVTGVTKINTTAPDLTFLVTFY